MTDDALRIRDAIAGFLRTQIIADAPVDLASRPLRDLGVDSFSLMEILLFVERDLGVKVPVSELTPERIESVDTLSAWVADHARRRA